MTIELKNLKYKNILNIQNLVIDTYPFAILGKSGSGKSTLLRLLGDCIEAQEGEILIDGVDKNQILPMEYRKILTLVPQRPVIYEGTVKDNLVISLKFQNKQHPADELLLSYLKSMNLNVSLQQRASVLSGGEQQRICLIRVLLLNSKMYLLDEPTTSLDKGTEQDVMRVFFDECELKGSSVIFISHSENMTKEFAGQTITMQGGTVVD